MKRVSFLAGVFGAIGCLPFVVLALGLVLAASANTIPSSSLGMVAVGGIVVAFVMSANALMYWGVLKSLCEIHKVAGSTGSLLEQSANIHASGDREALPKLP